MSPTYYCNNCKTNHSVNKNGIAICPRCSQKNVKIFQNGGVFNILSANGKIECVSCGLITFSRNNLTGCVNGCTQMKQSANVPHYHYHVYSNDTKSKYIHDNFTALLDVARSGFGTEMKRDDVLEHLSSDIMIICVHEKAIIGFATIILFDDVLYLHGMAVHIAHQGCGIGKSMLRKVLKTVGKVRYFTLTTQSSYVYSWASSFCKVIFPNNSSLPEENVISKINKIAAKLSITLSPCQDGNFLIKKYYTRCLYQRLPGIEESAVFKNNLRVRHWRSRDALLLFGQFKT
jgi:hypothetical protein